MTQKHFRHETVTICGKQQHIQACLTWNSYPYVVNNKWHTNIFYMKQLSMWQTTANDIQACFDMKQLSMWQTTAIPACWQTTYVANDTQAFLTWNSYPYVANNCKTTAWNSCPCVQTTGNDIQAWKSYPFDMKQLSICGQWHQHFWHASNANDTQAFLTWNSYPYVANNSKWHTSIFDMKQLSICGKQQQMTYKHFDMKQLSICGKQQQMTHKHVWHETVIHMWQTTANDIQAFWTWNSYPYVANNSKWHTSIFDMKQLSICGKQQQMINTSMFDMKQLSMWQTTANDTQACLTWNSYPYVANNSKWHRSIFDMKQLSIC